MKNKILGVEIDNVNLSEAVSRIQGFLNSSQSHYVVTPGPEFLMLAKEDQEFKNILNNASLSICDGTGLWLASRYLKKPLTARITGIDLIWQLAKKFEKSNYSFYLLGAKDKIAEKAAEKMVKRYPGIKIVGSESGFRFWGMRLSDKVIIDKINRAKPDLLLVAFGAPKQEKWIYHNLPKLKSVKVAIGVGGSFDFIAGKIKRAPVFFRKMGFEWLWRLLMEPWRLPRILRATYHFTKEIIRSKKNEKLV